MKKKCCICKKLKELEEFHKHPKMKLGRQPECKSCKYTRNLESKRRNWAQYLLTRAKHRAKKKQLDFNLTLSDIVIPEKCPFFEVKFDDSRFSPSLDRIDPKLGYVVGNVQVISKLANHIKWDTSPGELRAFCTNYLKQVP